MSGIPCPASATPDGVSLPLTVIWSAIGVCFTVLGGIGWMAYAPEREAQAQLKVEIRDVSDDATWAITTLANQIVTQKVRRRC